MRIKYLYTVCMAVCLLTASSRAIELPDRDHVWVFVMAGQSNMAGRGAVEAADTVSSPRIFSLDTAGNVIRAQEPLHRYEPRMLGLDCGMSFARTLLASIPGDISILLVPTAVGGSSISQWLNGETHRNVPLLDNFREKVRLAAQYGQIKALLWLQGESDATENAAPLYPERLARLMRIFRETAGDSRLPLLLGEIGAFSTTPELFGRINAAIGNFAAGDTDAAVIPTRDLEDRGDRLHFNSEGQRELGARYATAYLNLRPKDMHTDSQEIIRPAAQAGRFYEADSALLRQQVQGWLDAHRDVTADDSTAALIVPHAGHRYSGTVAAAAYMTVPAGRTCRRIFIIGPSHHVALDGASVAAGYSAYATPLGLVPVDTALCRSLIRIDGVFTFREEAHETEHCIEVQLPFLQVRLENLPPIVPIVINTGDIGKIRRMAEALKPYFNEENLFVISSDFSHYPSYEDACRIDARTGAAVATGDWKKFLDTVQANAGYGIPGLRTSACGEAAITMLLMLLDHHCEVQHLLYRNAGDADASHRDQVVGYHAFGVTRHRGFHLRAADRKELLTMARESIAQGFKQKTYIPEKVGDMLQTPCGAFVTLYQNGELRGCVGHIGDDTPLWDVVCRVARMAAFQDSRFPPLWKSELKRTDIEISVLTPPKRINSIDEFIPGKHGILMIKDGRRGTYLPQVADTVPWTKVELLSHCAEEKAGIGKDGWKDAELYIYEAVVFP
ncbi:MAG: AmmeMemoRadiSam system protein B [Bacteroidales bacterium]|nr:AmmeMemoRadiSam system protein B [Bacteroidales bacterium]